MTALSVNNNIKKERGGKYDTEMVALLMLLFDADVWKLLLLTQGLVIYIF